MTYDEEDESRSVTVNRTEAAFSLPRAIGKGYVLSMT